MEATNSFLSTAKLCRRKFYFNHRLMLTHKAKALPLRRGSGGHAIMEGFYGEKITDPSILAARAHEAYSEGIQEALPFMSESQIRSYYKDETMVSGLAYAYPEYYASDLENWQILACETPAKARPVHPSTGQQMDGSTYGGVLDLVVRVRDTGKVVLVEHKTTGKLDETYWAKLMNDPQLSGYWLLAHASGFEIEEIMYNVIQLPGIRQRKTETTHQYHQRLRGEMVDNPDKYFHRKKVTRTQEQLREFLHNTWGWLEELNQLWDQPMYNWLKSDVVACTAFNRPCEFMEPCSFGLEGPHMLAFTTRDIQNPEYSEVS